jgi:putative intracellular protease/amidase
MRQSGDEASDTTSRIAMTRTHDKPPTVHHFVHDGMADWETGYATAQLNRPTDAAHPAPYRVVTVAERRAPVRTMGGMTIVPDMALDELRPNDSALLILCGGSSWDEGKNGEAVETARAFLAAGVPVAAICGATAGLARGGLLHDRPHTSNALEYLQATGYRGSSHYRHDRVVTDGDLITAGGVSALEFARAIFERLEVYSPAVIQAWYGLFRTGEAKYFGALMQAVGAEGGARRSVAHTASEAV